jgi:prolyl 4-hydroxylase
MEHPLVACLLIRARSFMGSILLPIEPFSTPQLVRYFPSQKYDLHTDFWPEHQITTDENTGTQV